MTIKESKVSVQYEDEFSYKQHILNIMIWQLPVKPIQKICDQIIFDTSNAKCKSRASNRDQMKILTNEINWIVLESLWNELFRFFK